VNLSLRRCVVVFAVVLALVVGSSAAFASSLTIMQTEEPRSLDPSNHSATYTASVLHSMYENLTALDEEYEIVPGLATDWEQSEDGMKWTFYLRSGVAFHDGTPFDADAVKTAVDRMIDPDKGLVVYGRLGPVIEEVEVVDDLTVVFHLQDPYPAFTRLMAIGQAAIVSPSVIDDVASEPVGTGPYKFVEYVSGERVVMERNENYWGEVPEVEQLVWRWSPEDSVLVMALQTGEVDVVTPLPPAHVSVLEQYQGVEVIETPGARAFWVALNTTKEPLDDVRVRQALNYATDRQGLIDSILWGSGTVANSPVSPGNFGYDETLEAYPHDPERARELLAEAGYEDGFSIAIAVQEAEAQYVEALQGMWREVGVDVIVDQMEGGIWSDAVFAPKEENEVQASFASWSSATLDADMMLTPLFATDSFPPASANLGFYSNERVDELLQKAAFETDPEAREAMYIEAQGIIHEEAAHITLWYGNNIVGLQDNIEGIWTLAGGMLVVRNPRIVE